MKTKLNPCRFMLSIVCKNSKEEMTKIHLTIIALLLSVNVFGQTKTAEEYGFIHLQFDYKSDKVDILIKSKAGEEHKKKPLFFFCQGSLPQPLIKYDENGVYGLFPFNPDNLTNKYHLVIVSKPYIPLICDAKTLSNNHTYIDSTGHWTAKYSERNLLSYYVDRNIAVIKFLQKQDWVSKKQVVVAGHSEGSTIAAKMANVSSLVTHLIYASGNPMGRIMSMIQQGRAMETDTDSIKQGEAEIEYWQNVV
ncbi:MAG: hypothetical protein LBV75_02545, partial [Paludibacter sp.]|nr:hypothetical protein [Paludibacter sp.]